MTVITFNTARDHSVKILNPVFLKIQVNNI